MPARLERQGRKTRASPTRTLVMALASYGLGKVPFDRAGVPVGGDSEHSVAQSVCPVGSPQTVSVHPRLELTPVGGNPHVFST